MLEMSTIILGISACYHDSAAALLIDGQIFAAAQEDRFSRKKHVAGFPTPAVSWCLEEADITLKDKLFLQETLRSELAKLSGLEEKELSPLLFTEHREAHAASAFYPSPYDRAAFLTPEWMQQKPAPASIHSGVSALHVL